MPLWCSALRSDNFLWWCIQMLNPELLFTPLNSLLPKIFQTIIFLTLPVALLWFPCSLILFHLTSVSDNYTTVLVEHLQTILFFAITFLFRDFFVHLPCMIAFILHSVSNFGDILSVFIPVDFLSVLCHFGLSSCPQQRSALCTYSSLYIFIYFLFLRIAHSFWLTIPKHF